MINPIRTEYEHELKSPMLTKMDDPGIPTIACSINRLHFQRTVCDTGSGVNITAKVTYEMIFGKLLLHPTYIQLQMADQTYRFAEGMAKDVPVEIEGQYVLTDFLVLDMGEEEIDPPIILGRPFLNTTRAIIYVRTGEVISSSPLETYAAILILT